MSVRYRVRLSVVVRDSYEHAEEVNRKIHEILEKEKIYIDTSGISIESG